MCIISFNPQNHAWGGSYYHLHSQDTEIEVRQCTCPATFLGVCRQYSVKRGGVTANSAATAPHQFSSDQSLSCVWLSAQSPWTAARQASLSITNSRSLLKLMSIELVMPSNHLIFCHSLLLQPSIFPSNRIFSSETVLHMRWPKYWSFSFNISPSNGHPGLIFFMMDWLGLLAVQGTLKSLLQKQFKSINS